MTARYLATSGGAKALSFRVAEATPRPQAAVTAPADTSATPSATEPRPFPGFTLGHGFAPSALRRTPRPRDVLRSPCGRDGHDGRPARGGERSPAPPRVLQDVLSDVQARVALPAAPARGVRRDRCPCRGRVAERGGREQKILRRVRKRELRPGRWIPNRAFSASNAFGVEAVPHLVLISPAGSLEEIFSGWSKAKMEDLGVAPRRGALPRARSGRSAGRSRARLPVRVTGPERTLTVRSGTHVSRNRISRSPKVVTWPIAPRPSESSSPPATAPKTVKDEMRDNLIAKLKAGENVFPGILGYEKTVVPRSRTRSSRGTTSSCSACAARRRRASCARS